MRKASIFPRLNSNEAQQPIAIWRWALRLADALDKLDKLVELAELDLTGKAGHTVKVKADESGFELVP